MDILIEAHTVKLEIFAVQSNFTNPKYLCIAEIFDGIKFCQCNKGCHIRFVIINTGQKIR